MPRVRLTLDYDAETITTSDVQKSATLKLPDLQVREAVVFESLKWGIWSINTLSEPLTTNIVKRACFAVGIPSVMPSVQDSNVIAFLYDQDVNTTTYGNASHRQLYQLVFPVIIEEPIVSNEFTFMARARKAAQTYKLGLFLDIEYKIQQVSLQEWASAVGNSVKWLAL